MKKVYFGINGQFGDIIIQEPSLRKFINQNPKTKVVLGCSRKYSDILSLYQNYHLNVIDFKIWEGYDDWPTDSDKKFIEQQNFDYMFDPMPKHTREDWAAHLHQTEESGLMQNIKVDTTQVSLPRPENIIDHKKTVAISLFPNYPYGGIKSFSYQTVCNIVTVVRKLGFKVIHLSGPGEPDVPNTQKIQGSFLDSVRNLLGTSLLLTCDTAMSWVASAYSHPTLGFYSWGYNPVIQSSKNWQPRNINAKYIEDYCIQSIPPKVIISNIKEALSR